MSINRFGTLGHGFGEGPSQPNCECTVISGIEPIFEGELWIGAYINGLGSYVSTAIMDVISVRVVANGFKYSNDVGLGIQKCYTITDARFFSPEAISLQDFVADWTDANRVVPGTSITIPEHNSPLGISIRMEMYTRHNVRTLCGDTANSIYLALDTNFPTLNFVEHAHIRLCHLNHQLIA